MPYKRLSEKSIEREQKIREFFNQNIIKWEPKFKLSKAMNFFYLLSASETTGRWRWKKAKRIGQLYIDSTLHYAAIKVFDMKYEEYLDSIMRELDEEFGLRLPSKIDYDVE